jgi:hypothetical protein
MHQSLNEALKSKDLENLVKNVFEIDSYASKMGSDRDVVVLSFTVDYGDAAQDLVNFIERGYDYVLDADGTPGEMEDGKYKVFVELERTQRVPEQIMEILDGVEKLTGIEEFKFRYYKSFHSMPATEEELAATIPATSQDYENKIEESVMNNFTNFFNKSYLESIHIDNDDIVFQRKYSEPLRMRIKEVGSRQDVYASISGPLMLESKDMSEILYFTKTLGNYNITKIGTRFVFENNGFAVALEKR